MTDDLIGPPTLDDQAIVDDRIGRYAPRARMDDWWTALQGKRVPTRGFCRRPGATERQGRNHKLLDARYVLMDEPTPGPKDSVCKSPYSTCLWFLGESKLVRW